MNYKDKDKIMCFLPILLKSKGEIIHLLRKQK